MPTITTTVTSTSSTATTTVTTTEATTAPGPADIPAAASQPAVAAVPSKVITPKDETDVTPEWLTAALHERGTIPPTVKVVSIAPLVNIGEGRGYANFSWKIACVYDSPVNPDVPNTFVMKQLNRAAAPIWPAGKMRALADRSYCLEAYWYDHLRDRVPIAQPKGYWSGCDSAEDPTQEFGTYGVLMEYLGDDLKKADMQKGMTELELQQSVVAVAKLHATFWNGKNLNAQDKQALLSVDEATSLLEGFMGDVEIACKYVNEVLKPELGVKFSAYACQALRTLRAWHLQNSNGNTTLCSWDLRTDNMLWRKSPGGPEEYECVILDHQLWAVGASPMYDLCTHLAISLTEEQAKTYVALGLRLYHETLVECGVTTYSVEQMNKDFDNAVWHTSMMCAMGGKIVPDIEAGAMAHPEGSEARAEGMTMTKNLNDTFTLFGKRAANLAELREAWDPEGFTVPGY